MITGACPLDADGATVAVGDVAGQARQVMDNLVAALGAHDAPSTLVGVTVLGSPTSSSRSGPWRCATAWQEPAPPHDGPTVDG